MLGCWRLIIVSIYTIDRLHIHICWWYSCLYLRCYGTSDSTLLFYLLVAVIELLRYMPLYCDYGFFGSQGAFPLHIAVNIPLHYYYICFSLDVVDQLHVCICLWSRWIYLGGHSVSVGTSLLSIYLPPIVFPTNLLLNCAYGT